MSEGFAARYASDEKTAHKKDKTAHVLSFEALLNPHRLVNMKIS
jgi:hypothetical protein